MLLLAGLSDPPQEVKGVFDQDRRFLHEWHDPVCPHLPRPVARSQQTFALQHPRHDLVPGSMQRLEHRVQLPVHLRTLKRVGHLVRAH